MNPLTTEELADNWGNLTAPTPELKPRTYRYYHPLVDAADRFVFEAQDPDRIYTGVPQFDYEMRGIGRGHLCNIVGYSHSGKTLLLLKLLEANRDKRIAWFAPDETASLILTKLTSITTGIGARELETQVALGNQQYIDLLRATALETFPNLVVFDGPLTAESMTRGYDEAGEAWGDEAHLVVVDYVDLLQAGETPPQKFDFLKGFGTSRKIPMVAIHQTSRSAGAEGRAMTISSGNFGGEQHATFQIGVIRKKAALMAELNEIRRKQSPNQERIDELQHDLRIHEYTLTANLVKNKRPGGSLVDEIDFELDTETGALYPLNDGDMPEQYLALIDQMKAAKPKVSQPTELNDEGLFS